MIKSCVLLILICCLSCKGETHRPVIERAEAALDTLKKKSQSMNIDTVPSSLLMGHFDPEAHADFVPVPIKFADREGMYVQRVVLRAFEEMYEDALQAGITLVIRSATRNFEYQKGIWERKWTGVTTLSDGTKASDIASPEKRALKILEYSSMPGTSRHHWGTDIDLNAFNNAYFSSGEGLKIYNWLQANAKKYGFCQPYTSKESGRTGYNEEKWHWSYMPLSAGYTQAVKAQIENKMIDGFDGAETTAGIDVVRNYMLGINPDCIN